jgi:hypothetical protein
MGRIDCNTVAPRRLQHCTEQLVSIFDINPHLVDPLFNEIKFGDVT